MRATSLQLGDRAESPLAEVENRELGTAIERAIARLRPEYRSCILLRHVEGYSYEEIADTLDLPWGRSKPISIGPVMNCVFIWKIAGTETRAETGP